MKKLFTILFFTVIAHCGFTQKNHHIPHVPPIAQGRTIVKNISFSRSNADTILWAATDQPALYYAPNPDFPSIPAGFVAGTDLYLDAISGAGSGSITLECGQIFDNTQKIKVLGAKFCFGSVSNISADANSVVIFKLYKLDGSFINKAVQVVPGPGTLLSQATMKVQDIKKLNSGTETLFSGSQNIFFPTPFTFDSSYFISFDISQINPEDSIGLFTSTIGNPHPPEHSLTLFDGNTLFNSFADASMSGGWGVDIDLAIFPIIQQDQYSTISATVCKDSSFNFNGKILHSTGTYLDTIVGGADNGFDSIITLHLTQVLPDTLDIIDTICTGSSLSYHGTLVTTAGTYPVHLTNRNGCDSLIRLHLALTDIDTSITISGDTLTANQTNATYQWINCVTGTAVSGATSRRYIAHQSGNYEVVIRKYHCSDTSSCISIINSVNELEEISFRLQPNPVKDICTIFPGKIASGSWSASIYNVQGKLMSNLFTEQKLQQFTFSTNMLSSGIYFIKVTDSSGRVGVKKLVVE